MINCRITVLHLARDLLRRKKLITRAVTTTATTTIKTTATVTTITTRSRITTTTTLKIISKAVPQDKNQKRALVARRSEVASTKRQ